MAVRPALTTFVSVNIFFCDVMDVPPNKSASVVVFPSVEDGAATTATITFTTGMGMKESVCKTQIASWNIKLKVQTDLVRSWDTVQRQGMESQSPFHQTKTSLHSESSFVERRPVSVRNLRLVNEDLSSFVNFDSFNWGCSVGISTRDYRWSNNQGAKLYKSADKKRTCWKSDDV